MASRKSDRVAVSEEDRERFGHSRRKQKPVWPIALGVGFLGAMGFIAYGGPKKLEFSQRLLHARIAAQSMAVGGLVGLAVYAAYTHLGDRDDD